MRRAARTDANHREIVRALRAVGAQVADTSGAGNGFPDLVVLAPVVRIGDFQRSERVILMEVKDGKKPPSARALTPAQEKFAAEWHGHWCCVTSVDEALAVVAGR